MLVTPCGNDGEIAAILELALAPTVSAPARARAAVSAWLAGEFHDERLADIAVLLVSELVTNCVRHARLAADRPLRLNASLRESVLRLEVWDSGTDGRVARRAPRRGHEAGGFGLDLVARLCSAWGVDRDRSGTTVWLELPAETDTSS